VGCITRPARHAAAFAELQAMTNLQRLTLTCPAGLPPAHARLLAALPQLDALSIQQQATAEGSEQLLPALAELTQLRQLSLQLEVWARQPVEVRAWVGAVPAISRQAALNPPLPAAARPSQPQPRPGVLVIHGPCPLQLSLCTLSSLSRLTSFSISKSHQAGSTYVSMPWTGAEADCLAQVGCRDHDWGQPSAGGVILMNNTDARGATTSCTHPRAVSPMYTAACGAAAGASRPWQRTQAGRAASGLGTAAAENPPGGVVRCGGLPCRRGQRWLPCTCSSTRWTCCAAA